MGLSPECPQVCQLHELHANALIWRPLREHLVRKMQDKIRCFPAHASYGRWHGVRRPSGNVLPDVAASIARNRVKLTFSVERRVNISLATAGHTLS